MKKFLACALFAMLACGSLLAGGGGDKKTKLPQAKPRPLLFM